MTKLIKININVALTCPISEDVSKQNIIQPENSDLIEYFHLRSSEYHCRRTQTW